MLAVLVAAMLVAPDPADADAVAPGTAADVRSRAKDQSVEVVLQLARRQTGLQQLARAVSDPSSPRYGRYVNPGRIASRFGARGSTRELVRAFLRRRGIRSLVDATGSFAHAFVPALKARRLFGPIRPPAQGRIPRGLRGEVRAVLQLQAFQGQFLPRRQDRPQGGRTASRRPRGSGAQLEPPYVRTGTPAGCEQGQNATFQPDDGPLTGPAFTPNQIQAAYGASPLHAQGVTGQGGRAAVLIESFARRELRAFTECFGIEMPPTRLVEVGMRAGPAVDEAAMDLQLLTLMAPGLESLAVYAVGSGFWPVEFSAMLDRRNAPGGRRPQVISVSQGDCESDLARIEVGLTERVLATAAAAGVTVASGSGDGGSFCQDRRVGFYPGSSRWTTSVGGTALTLEESNEIADEVVWNDAPVGVQFAGGGGFSRYLRAPFYQRGLEGWGDRRGYPDVATMADGYPGIAVYCAPDAEGNCDPSGAANPFQATGNGTSAATPLFAGAVALANQARREAGAPALGFVNPLLYELGHGGGGALRDVIRGSNLINPAFGCCDAAPGYDLASGWGSVNAAGLAAVAASRTR